VKSVHAEREAFLYIHMAHTAQDHFLRRTGGSFSSLLKKMVTPMLSRLLLYRMHLNIFKNFQPQDSPFKKIITDTRV
jgi:hypothetical protein